MQDWIAEVKQQATGYVPGKTVTPGSTYTSWQASYALGVELMARLIIEEFYKNLPQS